jgi:arylsulfatase A-like enzyme/Flp pilus assembly protein TadD
LPKAPGKPNVLLITVDSLRVDHLGAYGGTLVPTPAIDALAGGGVRFDDAVTVVPITLPSHASILTGLYPARHGVRDNGPYPLPSERLTLAELLQEAGFSTAAFVGAFLLEKRYGLAQGFAVYDDAIIARRLYPGLVDGLEQRPANQTVDAALRWLDGHRGSPAAPFFLWVHMFDTQTPHVAPEPHASTHRQSPYRAAVAFIDEQIGRLIERLRTAAVLDRTIVVVVGSHGEALMDHNEETHGLLLYEPTVRVPMIWHYPAGLGRPRSVSDGVAATIDVVPTILGLLKLGTGVSFDGVDLFQGRGLPDRVVYLETLAPNLRHGWSPLFAARRNRLKYIDGPVPAYFDLASDPKEVTNPLTEAPDEIEPLRAALRREMDELFGAGWDQVAANAAPGADTLAKLHEMGYAPTIEPLPEGTSLDPADLVLIHDQHRILDSLIKTGRYFDAEELSRSVLGGSPLDAWVCARLSQALGALGKTDEAIDAALHAVTFQPRERHWLNLAGLFLQKGNRAAFEICLDVMSRIDPADGEIAILRGRLALQDGRRQDAAKFFEEARRVDPSRQGSNALTGLADLKRLEGDDVGARELFARAQEVDPTNVMAIEGLAGVEQRAGRVDAEAAHLKRLCTLRPATMLYFNRLAQLYASLDRRDEAVAVLKDFVARNRNDAAAVSNLGNVYLSIGDRREAIAQYRKSLEMRPDYAVARFNLANALAAEEEYDEAIEEFRKVVGARPDHWPSSFQLMRLLTHQNRLDEAFEELERAAFRKIVVWDEIASSEDLAALAGDPRFHSLRQPSSP